MIITLCGSARFEAWFHRWNKVLTLSGHCVFGLGAYPSIEGGKDWYSPEYKEVLDKVHKDKIAASDGILVLNPFAYLGSSTLSEIEYAHSLSEVRIGRLTAAKVRLYSLQSWGKGCGITQAHNARVRDRAQRYGVEGCSSPIDIMHDGHPFRSCWDLLPEGGPFRSQLVEMIGDQQ